MTHFNWRTTPIWVTKRYDLLHKESMSDNTNILLEDENSSNHEYEENIPRNKNSVWKNMKNCHTMTPKQSLMQVNLHRTSENEGYKQVQSGLE